MSSLLRVSVIHASKLFTRPVSTLIESQLNFINGERTNSLDSVEHISVIEPATGKQLVVIESSGAKDLAAAVASAKEAFQHWSSLPGYERGRVLLKASEMIREYIYEIAYLEVQDSGKPLWEALFDIESCADSFEYYGGIAGSISGQHIPLGSGRSAIVQREPLGVCAGIGAWNFPFLIASWKTAPALACGNTMIFKPSQLTPLTSVVLGEILTECGLPPGGFNVIQGGAKTGHLICNEPSISKVSFTGSVKTGIDVMTSCAQRLKHVTLELGGKSPLIIFEDSNLEEAVKATMMANFLSQGQVCSNATRVFVQKSISKPFLEKLLNYTKKLKIGDPMDEETKIGATINEVHAEKILNYIESAKDEGATVLCGGERVSVEHFDGVYLSPCVLYNCNDSMKAVKEEIFGAVAAILEFESEEEVIVRANNTDFGLAAGVFTNNLSRAHRVSNQLQSGIVWINNYNLYPPQVPFGGYKMSGIGREGGTAVIDHYTQLKTIMTDINHVDCPLIDRNLK